MITQLNRIIEILEHHFEIDDWQAVNLLLAIAAAHYILGEMLWVYLIGASRSLKTEMLRALASHPDTYRTDYMTPGAVRGGFRKGEKVLDYMDQKLVITKDFASILTADHEQRTSLAGILRCVADGEFVANYGSDEGRLEQKAWFDWIIATTRIYERQRVFADQLGTRFLNLRWGVPITRQAAAKQAGNNNPRLSEIRRELAEAMCELLDHAKLNARNDVPDYVDLDWLALASDTLAILRTSVIRDSYSKFIEDYPEPELPTSIQQAFVRIVGGLHALGITDYKPYISRLVWNGIPSTRAKVINNLMEDPNQVQEKIAKRIKVSQQQVGLILSDLSLLDAFEGGEFKIDISALAIDTHQAEIKIEQLIQG